MHKVAPSPPLAGLNNRFQRKEKKKQNKKKQWLVENVIEHNVELLSSLPTVS